MAHQPIAPMTRTESMQAARAERVPARAGGRTFPWYPFIPTLLIVYTIWARSAIHVDNLFRPAFVSIAISALVLLVMTVIAQNRHAGGLAALAVMVGLAGPNVGAIGLVGLGLAVALLGRRHLLRGWAGPALTWRLNLIAAGVVAVMLVNTSSDVFRSIRADLSVRVAPWGQAKPGSPDIYIILLDGYPGTRAATSLVNWFDRDAFPRALEARGFSTDPDSSSNYLRTSLTLASMFSMRYLQAREAADPWLQRRLVDESDVLRRLNAAGYETISISAGYPTEDIRAVNRRLVPFGPTQLDIGTIRSMAGGRLLEAAAPGLAGALQRARIEDGFSALEALSDETHERPRFTFVHVPAPHGPWVFGPSGETVDAPLDWFYSDNHLDLGLDREFAIDRSFGQAAYIGKRTIEAIDHVLSASRTEPVVVVFSDHGPAIDYRFQELAPTGLSERSSNVLAIRDTAHPGIFPQGTTLVNVFPILLRTYLDADISRQPDKTYNWNPQLGELQEVIH